MRLPDVVNMMLRWKLIKASMFKVKRKSDNDEKKHPDNFGLLVRAFCKYGYSFYQLKCFMILTGLTTVVQAMPFRARL
jgi:hypothetical protein